MFNYTKVGLASLVLACLSCSPSPASAADDSGLYGSIITSGIARKASRALKLGAYSEAQSEFKKVLGKDDDFYFGFYEASVKLKQWDQATLALEQLFEKRPALKDQMSMEYGECLFKLNRFDEAEPQLKRALAKVNETPILPGKLRTLFAKADPPEAPPEVGPVIAVKPPVVFTPPTTVALPATAVNEDTAEALTLLNAFLKSESIVIAEFKSFEPDGMVTFNNPPGAVYKVTEILKGPPLNRTLPIRYEFHSKINSDVKPADWKWSPALMPKVGSKWIIFIQYSVPIDGKFETFHGSFGRQEYNEQNLDEVHRIRQEHQGQAK
jgi:tetratricopeptide (TPR) repeat protein